MYQLRPYAAHVILAASLVLFGTYFFFDLPNQFLLWAAVLASTISLGIILSGTGDERTKTVAILAFVSAYHLVISIRGNAAGVASRLLIGTGNDEAYQAQLDSLVYASGFWSPGMGIGRANNQYSNYPMLPLLYTSAANLLGPQSGIAFFVNVIFPVATACLPVIFYLNTMRLLLKNNEWAMLTTYVFVLNEQFIFFDAGFSYESIAIVFFTAVLYLGARKLRSPGSVLQALLLVSLTFAHFWTDLNIVLFMCFFYAGPLLFQILRKPDLAPYSETSVLTSGLPLLLFAGMAFLAYLLFIATSSATSTGAGVIAVILTILFPAVRYFPGISGTLIEVALTVWGKMVLVLLGTMGLLSRGRTPSGYLKLLFIIGGLYIVGLEFGVPQSVSEILQRGFFFGFFLVAPVVSWTIVNSKPLMKQFKTLLLVFVMVSMIIGQQPFLYSSFVASDSLIFAGYWSSARTPFGSPLVALRTTGAAFGGYGGMQDLGEISVFYLNKSIVLDSIYRDNSRDLIIQYNVRYVALSGDTDQTLTTFFIGEYTLAGNSYVKHVLTDYSGDPMFSRIFNAGNVTLYYVTP